MLRLRAYEKLQNLVFRGAVKKSGKFYTGNSPALAAMAANAQKATRMCRLLKLAVIPPVSPSELVARLEESNE